jgi:hypothetical protein
VHFPYGTAHAACRIALFEAKTTPLQSGNAQNQQADPMMGSSENLANFWQKIKPHQKEKSTYRHKTASA